VGLEKKIERGMNLVGRLGEVRWECICGVVSVVYMKEEGRLKVWIS
jgi:hypothetical protein